MLVYNSSIIESDFLITGLEGLGGDFETFGRFTAFRLSFVFARFLRFALISFLRCLLLFIFNYTFTNLVDTAGLEPAIIVTLVITPKRCWF